MFDGHAFAVSVSDDRGELPYTFNTYGDVPFFWEE
jgi:hypothetical protein